MFNLSLFQIILLSTIITLTLSYTLFKIRSAYLGRFILETRLKTLKPGNAYRFFYRHSFLNVRSLEIVVPDEEATSYILREITYYNYKQDASITVMSMGVVLYSVDLRNMIDYNTEKYEEEDFDGNF